MPVDFILGLAPVFLYHGVDRFGIDARRPQFADLAIELGNELCIIGNALLVLLAGNISLLKLSHGVHLSFVGQQHLDFPVVPKACLFA